jgi:DNA polymerase-3 subunit delta'
LEQLRQAVRTGRLASSYLFSGPEGIGKKLTAVTVAGEMTGDPQRTENGSHPDVIFVTLLEDRKDIVIEQTRELQASVQMHPLESPYKIVIIDNAEKMNSAAANSLLKILEEPPKATHFFLISSRPHMLLPTILSRCQKLNFAPPVEAEAVPFIAKKLGVDEARAGLLYLISGGSIGLALAISTEMIGEAGVIDDVIEKMAAVLGKPSPTRLISIAEGWAKGEAPRETILAIIAHIYHQAALKALGTAANAPPKLAQIIDSVANNTTAPDIQRRITAVISAQRDIEATYNKQLLFEQLLFTLTA